MTIYSHDVLLSQFGTSPLFHVCPRSTCCFLTYVQISQEAGRVVWYSHLFKNFPHFAVIHTVKGFGIVHEAEIPDHFTCLLRNLYAGQEATDLHTDFCPVRTGHGTTNWFQIGKGVHQGCILSSCLFNLYAEYSMRNAGLEEAQAGIKRLLGKISISSDMQMTPPLWQKVKKN